MAEEAQKKRSVGRPSKYKPEYCDEAENLGRQGKSLYQMAAHFGVARQTIDQWKEDHPEFSDALTRAKTFCQAWWEDAGQLGVLDTKFNGNVWIKTMQARFREDYTEKRQVEHSGTIDHSAEADEAKRRLAALTAAGTGASVAE